MLYHNNIIMNNQPEPKANLAEPEAQTNLVALQQKIVDKQVTYLILNSDKTKKYWVKLCDAKPDQTLAIMKYQSDKNVGAQPIYRPEGDQHDSPFMGPAINDEKKSSQYNLRQRELLLISKHEFYGLGSKQQKKQNILAGGKTKNQIKKQQIKGKSLNKRQRKQSSTNRRAKKQLGVVKQKVEHTQPRKRKAKMQIIDVEKRVGKRKLIKKNQQIKAEKPKLIQIYDGSDSQIKML